jgi:small subunit ribosomal protein S6
MRTYEVLYILSPQVPEEEATALSTEFKRVAETTGATLKNEEAWGRRRLAYPIHKFTEGNYQLFVFESASSLAELDRRMKNSDRVLRHMIVRTDEDQKRADKLAKRNPKKERMRPSKPLPKKRRRRDEKRGEQTWLHHQHLAAAAAVTVDRVVLAGSRAGRRSSSTAANASASSASRRSSTSTTRI